MWQETRAKYTDAEVDAIVAVHRAISDAHHSKYTDAEAVNAVETEGKIGINNPSPANMLDVVGLGVTKDTPVIPDNEDTISIYGDGRAYFKGRDVTNDIEFLVGTSTAGYAFAGAMTNHDYRLRTNNTDRLTVKAATGRVGVGTTTPGALLDVNGDAIIRGDVNELEKLIFKDPTELTISGGVITVTQSRHSIDTQNDDGTDDLVTINGGEDGQILILNTENSARDVTLKHGTGNILISGGDYTIDSAYNIVMLIYTGTYWMKLM